jgi:hypothetical protein
LSGKWVEKAEVSTPDDFAAIEAMSRVELEAYILAGVDQLKLEHEQTKLIEDGQKAIEAKPQSDGD